MPPAQSGRNGQSAKPTEISIPGLTLATYSRSTDPALAPKRIKHKPRISSSKRKESTTPHNDAKRAKSDDSSIPSVHIPARYAPMPPIPEVQNSTPPYTPVRTESSSASTTTENTANNILGPTHTKPIPKHIPNRLKFDDLLRSFHSVPRPVNILATPPPTPVDIAADGSVGIITNRMDTGHITTASNSQFDTRAVTSPTAIPIKIPPNAVVSPANTASAESDGATMVERLADKVTNRPQIEIESHASPHSHVVPIIPPSAPIAAREFDQVLVVPDPPAIPIVAETNHASVTILRDPVKRPSKVPDVSGNHISTPSNISPIAKAELGLSALVDRPVRVDTPSPTPATYTAKAKTAPVVHPSAATEISSAASRPAVPPIPLDAIGTLQRVSTNLSKALGNSEAPDREDQLFIAVGVLQACLDAHFKPHIPAWEADSKLPKVSFTIPTTSPLAMSSMKAIAKPVSIPKPPPTGPRNPDLTGELLAKPLSREALKHQLASVRATLQKEELKSQRQSEDLKLQAEVLKLRNDTIYRLKDEIKQSAGSLKLSDHQNKQMEGEIFRLERKVSQLEGDKRQLEEINKRMASRLEHYANDASQSSSQQVEIRQAHHFQGWDLSREARAPADMEEGQLEEGRSRWDMYGRNENGPGQGGGELRMGLEMDDEVEWVAKDGTGQDQAPSQMMADAEELEDETTQTTQNYRPSTPIRIFEIKGKAQTPGSTKQDDDPSTPTKQLKIKGQAQTPRSVISSVDTCIGNDPAMAIRLSNFEDLKAKHVTERTIAAEKATQDVLGSGSAKSNHTNSKIRDPIRATQKDKRNVSPPPSMPDVRKDISKRPRRATFSASVASDLPWVQQAMGSIYESQSPWEKARAEGKAILRQVKQKAIPTGPRSDRSGTPPIGPRHQVDKKARDMGGISPRDDRSDSPPIGPRLPVGRSERRLDGTGPRRDGPATIPIGPRLPDGKSKKGLGWKGSYYSKDSTSKITSDRYNRVHE